jgi:hypothetical protein
MYQLLGRYFDGVSREQFARDLSEKTHVIRLQRGDELVGFSTLLAYETHFEDESVSLIYSGDTIVAPEAWGTTALPRAWIAAVNQIRLGFPRGRYYWLLLTSGFRTYRFLPLFWREFHPRYDHATPPEKQRLLDHLARSRFNDQYDPARGIVRFHQPQRLRPELSGIPEARAADPHIHFFETRNPGHIRGDELVCLTELTPENLTPAGRRMIAARAPVTARSNAGETPTQPHQPVAP